MKAALLALIAAQNLTLGGTYRTHTGDFIFRQASIELQPQTNLFWNYSGEPEQLMGVTINYTQNLATHPAYRIEHQKILLGIRNKLNSRQSYHIAFGYEEFKSELATVKSGDSAVGKLEYEHKAGDNFDLALAVERTYAVDRYELKSAEASEILVTSIQPRFQYRPKEDQQLRFRGQWESIELGDEVTNLDLQWLKGLSRSEKWVWAGLGLNSITHSKTNALYWSPSRFISVGPRLEASWPLFGKVSGFVSGSWHWLREESLDAGSGTYVNLGLESGPRENYRLRLSYEGIASQQGSTDWNSDGVQLKFLLPF